MKKVLIVLSFMLLALLVIQPVHNEDVWMHIKSGEVMLRDMRVLSVDDYSYTAQGAEWLNHQWLSQILYYLFYRVFGVNGLIYLKAILIFSAFFLLFRLVYRNSLWSVFLFILAIMVSQERFLARPLVFSLFLFSVFVFILHKYKYSWSAKKENMLYLLIPLQILWMNLHGAAIIGIFLIWAYIAGEFIDSYIRHSYKDDFVIRNKKYKKLLYVGILVLVSTGLTPYGYNAILFPLKEAGEMYFITEWLPSIYEDSFLNLGVMPYYRLFLFISMAVFIMRARIISSAHIIMFSVFMYLSLGARRHLPFFSIAVAPYIIQYTKGVEFKKIPQHLKRFFTQLSFAGIFIFLLLAGEKLVTGTYFMKMPNGPRVGLGKIEFPDDAVDFIIESGLDGNMFNDYGSGCFLIWRFYPDRRVYLDGRNTIYGSKFIKEEYMDRMINPLLFEELARRRDLNYVFLHYALSNTENLIPYLYYSGLWELVFLDDRVCIFARNNEQNAGIIEKYRVDLKKKKAAAKKKPNYRWQHIYPHDHVNRSSFYEKLGFLDMAIETTKEAIALDPDVGDLYYNLGSLYLKKGMIEDAVREFKKAIRSDRNDIDAYNNLGVAYARAGKYKEAVDEFKKVLCFNPLHGEARKNLKRARRDLKRQIETTQAVQQ